LRQKVVIVGGGVAGLTAAHELIERDYDVTVVERRDYYGGKAASYESKVGNLKVPGEHGFRFFPGWYRNLPHTMARILYQGQDDPFFEGKNVLDNLVALEATVLAQYEKDYIPAVFHLPRSASQAEHFLAFWTGLRAIGLPFNEAFFFFKKMQEFLLTPEEERRERFDNITWWDFLEAGKRSEAFRVLIEATTRTTVAAKAKEASAYTIAKIAIATFLDGFTKPDRVLNGPTSEVWLEPWVTFLTKKGVDFQAGLELDVIKFEHADRTIDCLVFNRVVEQNYARLLNSTQQALDEIADLPQLGKTLSVEVAVKLRRKECDGLVARLQEMLEPYPAKKLDNEEKAQKELFPKGVSLDHGPRLGLKLHALLEELRELLESKAWSEALADLAPTRGNLAAPPAKPAVNPGLKKAYESAQTALQSALKVAPNDPVSVKADHFIFALPVEQMAYYVNRSTTLTSYAPELRNVIRLSESVDWMAGIQFYLNEPIDLPRGSLICIDSEWALTAVQQTQFWRRARLPEKVHAVLSVDISAWSVPGRFNQLEAYRCKPLEIAEEAWHQLKASLNRPGKPKILRDEMLLTGKLAGSYALDENIVDRFDRKKQAAYERSWSVQFGAQEILEDVGKKSAPMEAALLTGNRMAVNLEPLLINRKGYLKLRPEAQTAISNMFLAGDYVNTSTNLACMEGANESARRAVNAILDSDGSSAERCHIFTPSDSDVLSVLSRFLEAGARVTQIADNPVAAAATNWLSDKQKKWKKLWG
jgi:uncharacterized protein with NAD-binding domain and iron-sulfur cluster